MMPAGARGEPVRVAFGREELHAVVVREDGRQDQDQSDAADEVEEGPVEEDHVAHGLDVGDGEPGGGESAHGLEEGLGHRIADHEEGDGADGHRHRPEDQQDHGACVFPEHEGMLSPGEGDQDAAQQEREGRGDQKGLRLMGFLRPERQQHEGRQQDDRQHEAEEPEGADQRDPVQLGRSGL